MIDTQPTIKAKRKLSLSATPVYVSTSVILYLHLDVDLLYIILILSVDKPFSTDLAKLCLGSYFWESYPLDKTIYMNYADKVI